MNIILSRLKSPQKFGDILRIHFRRRGRGKLNSVSNFFLNACVSRNKNN